MQRLGSAMRGALLAGLAASIATGNVARAEPIVVEGIAGTFQKPAGASTAVLIIAGSGPTNRDGNSPAGLKTDAYKQLAEALGKAGFATLSFDKRGVGESRIDTKGKPVVESALTIQTTADDAATLVAWLRGNAGITQIALVGHSEGGLVALLTATLAKADRVALLTAPGRPLGVILRQQLARQSLPPDLNEEIERVLGALERGGETGTIKPPLDQLFRQSVQPFLRSVLTMDPAALVAAQAAPILVIGAGSDLQVGRFDFNALVGARAGVNGVWVPRLTHVLKEVADDDSAQIRAYTDPSLPLMPIVAETLVRWLKE